ncbi:hypothetical protein CsatB_027821 [Cannabis sativa]
MDFEGFKASFHGQLFILLLCSLFAIEINHHEDIIMETILSGGAGIWCSRNNQLFYNHFSIIIQCIIAIL